MGDLDLDSVVSGVEDMNVEQQNEDVTVWSRSGLDGATIDAYVIERAFTTATPNLSTMIHLTKTKTQMTLT